MKPLPDVVSWWGIDRRVGRKLVVGFFLGLVLFAYPYLLDGRLLPDGLDAGGWLTMALFLLVIYLWATEALPLPVTALGAGVGLVLIGTFEPPYADWTVNDAWMPYAQDTIFFLLGSLILADAITKTGADRVIAARFLGRLGRSTTSLLFAVVAVSALSAMFISNHAVAAVMLPLVISILRSTGLIKERRIAAAFVLAIAFGAGVAGLGTPSGGSRNVIILGYLNELYPGEPTISYLDWTLRAAPITLVLIPVIFVLLVVAFRVPHRPLERSTLPKDGGKMGRDQRRTLGIMGLTVFLWITVGTTIGLGTTAIIGAILLFVFGILDWVDTRKRIAWGVPLIYGAALTMGQALQDTGAASWLAGIIQHSLSGELQAYAVVIVLVLSVALTNVMSDGGTAAVLGPVALGLAALIGFDIGTMGMVVAMGAAFGFLLVVANPANVIAYSSGLFTPKDLLRVGVPMTVVSILVTVAAVRWYWPWVT